MTTGHAEYFALLKRLLKPGGQVIMVDFKKAKSPVGPPMEIRIDREDLVREKETNGFQSAAENSLRASAELRLGLLPDLGIPLPALLTLAPKFT